MHLCWFPNSPWISQWSLTLIHARCHFSSKAAFVPRITLPCTFFSAPLCSSWRTGRSGGWKAEKDPVRFGWLEILVSICQLRFDDSWTWTVPQLVLNLGLVSCIWEIFRVSFRWGVIRLGLMWTAGCGHVEATCWNRTFISQGLKPKLKLQVSWSHVQSHGSDDVFSVKCLPARHFCSMVFVVVWVKLQTFLKKSKR